MGTPLPEIITKHGIECPTCLESSGPFPDGPTPLNPIMSIEGWSPGFEFIEAYRSELDGGVELLQQPAPCLWQGFTGFLGWFLDFRVGQGNLGILLFDPPNTFAFSVLAGFPCQVSYPNDLILPLGNIAFGGPVQITWGEII